MEILAIIIIVFLGSLAGIITGLLPGIHINLVAMLILTNFMILSQFFSIENLVIFIIVMGIVHSFVDFIPSVLFGVPSSDTALATLPGQRMVLEGNGYKAIYLSSIGSFFGMIFAIIISPIFYFSLENIYNLIKDFIPYLLIFTLIILIFFENGLSQKFWAIIIILFSSGFGMLVLNSNIIKNPLLIIFSGLFGISSIFISLNENVAKLPKQNFKFKFQLNKTFFKGIFIGGVSSSICSISPGIGNAQAGTIASVFLKNATAEVFIVILSSINTINFILSFLTLYLIDRARNGAVLVISQIKFNISFNDILIYFIMIIISCIIGFFLTLILGKFLIRFIQRINFQVLNYLILILIFFTVWYMTGLYEIFVMIVASFLGILCVNLNVKRIHLMSVLLVPIIFNLI